MKHFKQISIYTFVSFFGAGINFLLMPYLSYFISPGEYGLLSLINSYVTILIPLTGLVASALISVEFYRMKDKKEFALLFSSVQAIPILPTLFFLLLAILFSKRLAGVLEIPSDKNYWLSLAVVLSFLSIYYETLLSFCVIEKKPVHYAMFNLAKVIVEVGLTVWFVSHFRLGWEGRLLSWLIVSVLMFFVSLFYFYKRKLLRPKISGKYVSAGIAFGLPLILHTMGKFVINQSDRIFIAKMVSIEEAGIYNIGYQVGMVILLLVGAIGNFYQPFIYERLAYLTDEGKVQIVKISYMLLGGLIISLLLLSGATPLFFKWLINKNFSKGAIYVFWTGLSYVFWGVYIMFSSFSFFLKKTKFLGILSVINVVLNLGLNYVLICRYGALGAAYATCISFFVVAVVVFWMANKRYSFPWLNLRLLLNKD